MRAHDGHSERIQAERPEGGALGSQLADATDDQIRGIFARLMRTAGLSANRGSRILRVGRSTYFGYLNTGATLGVQRTRSDRSGRPGRRRLRAPSDRSGWMGVWVVHGRSVVHNPRDVARTLDQPETVSASLTSTLGPLPCDDQLAERSAFRSIHEGVENHARRRVSSGLHRRTSRVGGRACRPGRRLPRSCRPPRGRAGRAVRRRGDQRGRPPGCSPGS